MCGGASALKRRRSEGRELGGSSLAAEGSRRVHDSSKQKPINYLGWSQMRTSFRSPLLLLVLAILIHAGSSCRSAPSGVVGAPSAVLSEAGLAELRRTLASFSLDGDLPGSVALVEQAGELRLLGAFGEGGLQDGAPLATDSIFRIYSMTKVFTCVAALRLVEQGRLRLDDPISRYLPVLARPEVALVDASGRLVGTRPAEREVRVSELMNHTAGFTYGLRDETQLGELYNAADLVRPGESSLQFCERLAGLPLAFDPGSAWLYGLSTDVLGAVLEVAARAPLEEVFYGEIFEPLGMTDTAFHVPLAKRSRLAALFGRDEEGRLRAAPAPVPVSTPSFCRGGSGLFSTVTDYSRFCEFLLHGGEWDGVQLISPESLALLTADSIEGLSRARFMADRGFGLGVGVLTEESAGPLNGTVGSFHWSGFAGSSFFVDPELDLIGVLMIQVMDDYSYMVAFRKAVYGALTPGLDYPGSEVGE